MVRCPVCASPRVIVQLDRNRRAACRSCGATWVQDGGDQRLVRRNARRNELAVAAASGDRFVVDWA
jgi:hypothetical protein